MPRLARATAGGMCYHVLNSGNGRARVFRKDEDRQAFIYLMAAAGERLPKRVWAGDHVSPRGRPRGRS